MIAARRIVVSALLALLPLTAWAQDAGGNRVWERTIEIVRDNFYDPDGLAGFEEAVTRLGADAAGDTLDAAIGEALAATAVSHTGRYTQDRIDYYELIDIYRFAVRRDVRRLFPPDGEVSYPGIGLIAAEIDGAFFAADVYHAGSAARAGVQEGDEILSVDGEPYAEIASFDGKVGETVALRLRREAEAEPVELAVEVETIKPNTMFTESISQSIRIVEHEGYDIGYIRLWSFTSNETRQLINEELGTGRLANADALILDLRNRWGGAPLDAAKIFVGRTPPTELVRRDGSLAAANVRWRKPVVAIIDEGTRSGLEVFAHALKLNGIPLVGRNTAGAVVAGQAFTLPDDSLLLVAVADVLIDGRRLEGAGVAPDITVKRDIRYENGVDPQIEAALEALAGRL